MAPSITRSGALPSVSAPHKRSRPGDGDRGLPSLASNLFGAPSEDRSSLQQTPRQERAAGTAPQTVRKISCKEGLSSPSSSVASVASRRRFSIASVDEDGVESKRTCPASPPRAPHKGTRPALSFASFQAAIRVQPGLPHLNDTEGAGSASSVPHSPDAGRSGSASSAAPSSPSMGRSGFASSAAPSSPSMGRSGFASSAPPHSPDVGRSGSASSAAPSSPAMGRSGFASSAAPSSPVAGSDEFAVPVCPRAPARPGSGVSLGNRFLRVARACETGVFNDERITPLGEGNYKRVYALADWVVKVYKINEQLMRNNDAVVEWWTENAVKQYMQLRTLRIPVARLYNNPLLEGYFACERLYEVGCLEKALSKKPEELTGEELVLVKEYQKFVLLVFRKDMHIDINFDNFGKKKDGTLALLDLMENYDPTDAFAFGVCVLKNLKNPAMVKFLLRPITEQGLLEKLQRAFTGYGL